MNRRIATLLLSALLLTLTACGGPGGAGPSPGISGDVQPAPASAGPLEELTPLPTADPSGAAVSIPERVESIVALAPSLCETLVVLGQGDKLVGYDLQSVGLAGLPVDVPTFDTVNPDVERLAAMAPDLLLVSSLALYDQEAPYQPLIDAGVCVICVPTSQSIENVRSDIRFLAAALRVPEAGEAVVARLDAELDGLAAVAGRIPEEERKSVYFEISAAPYLYSCGSDTYLDEMIRWVGGKNILAGQTGWLSVEGEAVVAADPDVIFTNVNYIDAPVEEILARDGWAGVAAVAGGQVYYIDNMSSSLPNQNIVVAMEQMAQALYPEYFAP